jgi:hypothetical protein
MNRRLPPDAMEYYVSLGADRSYQSVADHFGVAKITVTRLATDERWQERIRDMEQNAREKSEKRIADQMDAVRERHISSARILQGKALEALKNLPAEKAIRAASALAIGWKHELLILGEPTERNALSVEEVTRQEINSLLTVEDTDDDEWEATPA